LLTADATGRLTGMERVTVLAIVISLFVPLLAAFVERGVRAREATSARGY
jgi:hypothetical protein